MLSVIPSLMLPFLISPSNALYYLLKYKTVSGASFGDMFVEMHALPYEYFWIGIIGAFLFIFVLAILFGTVDRHMRIGEFTVSFRRAKTRLNYNLLTSIKFVAVVAVAFELTNLASISLYYLWAVAFGPGVTWLIFSLLSVILTSFILLMVMSTIILWPPFMLHTGLNSIEAFKMGWQQMSGKVMPAAFTLFITMLPFQFVMLLTGIFDCGVVVQTILDGLCYAVLLPVYVVLMYEIFYDVTGTERMDLQKVDIWSKKLPK